MAVKVRIGTKAAIGVIGVLVIGWIGFQVLTRQNGVRKPELEASQQANALEARRITAPRFDMEAEDFGDEKRSVPKKVPTAQSDDDEIREFLAWLSSLEREDTTDETEGFDGKDDAVDYRQERAQIESVIWDKLIKGYESQDVERYMSAMWEDDFFFISDLGTPDDPSDDIIVRGQRERELATEMSKIAEDIEVNYSPRSEIQFLSDTIAMAEYDYEAKVLLRVPESKDEMVSGTEKGDVIIVLERRENAEGTGEWRILEWYNHLWE